RHRIPARTHTGLTRVALRTRVAVVTRCPVRRDRIRTLPRRGIARPRRVTLIRPATRHRIPARTHALLTRVVLRTRVAIVTRCPVRRHRILTLPRRAIARPLLPSSTRLGSRHRIPARTHAGLTRVGLRTRVAVVTRRPVRRDRIRTLARRGVTRPGRMTLI